MDVWSVFLSGKKCLEFIVTAVCIWTKWILDEIIGIYLVHVMCLEFHLYLWCCIDSMEFVKTHILMDILCIESFGALIKNTIWYWSWKWCLYILHCENYWKGTIYFIPFICFFRVSNNSAWYTGEVLGVRFYFYWIFGFTHPSMCEASSASGFPDLLCLDISLTKFFIFL